MSIGTDFSIDNSTKNIRYTGDAHGSGTAGYYTVLAFHRWLQDLADNAAASGDDFLDMTRLTPSDKSFDTIINLINGFNIDQTASEHLYQGSIIQGGGSDIWDGVQVIANQGMDLQIVQNGAKISGDFWNYNVKGTHTGSNGVAVLTDSTKSWTTGQWVGYYIKNTTDSSFALITANTATTITGTLYGGTNNDWSSSDAYSIVQGLNFDTAAGYSHQFLLKVTTSSADIDGRKIIGQTRVWGKTFSEFRIATGTSRGNNVMALTYANDLNNTTAYSALASSPFTGISNGTDGYVGIDVNNDTVNEDYWSDYTRGTATINQFYEWFKYETLDRSAASLYGLTGGLFRGITHEIALSTGSGTWGTPEHEALSWSGGTGQLIAVNNKTASAATKMWIQLLTGVAPTNGQVITGGVSTATGTASGTATDRTLSYPAAGVSTGSSIIGGYGFGIVATDLSAADKVFDLTNTLYQAPNYVTFSVGGLSSSDPDYILVTNNNAGDIDYSQFTLNGTLSGASVTAVVVNEAIPADTPASATGKGGLRILRASGVYTLHAYTSYNAGTKTFTIPSTDFSSDHGTNGANAFLGYLDKAAGSATESFTAVYSGSDRTVFVRRRYGGVSGGGPTKTFETTGTLGSAGGSVTVQRQSDA